jgi:hypothetical protein
MKKVSGASLLLASLSLLLPLSASASSLRTFVKELSVSSPANADLRQPLRALLVSRLSGNGIETVEAQGEADVVVSSSYTQLGKIFSIDAVARNAAGRELAVVFEQGDSQDAVIPAIGKVAAKLKEELLKQNQQKAAAAAQQAPAASAPAAAPAQPGGSVIWTSQRIAGAQAALAQGERNLVATANGNSIRLYRKGATLTLVAETKIPDRMKLVAIDSLPSADGSTLLFASIVDDESAASRIYRVKDGGLEPLAEDVPYLFRTVAPFGGKLQLFAQQLGRQAEYFGDVYEASFENGKVQVKNPVKMPRFANIFNFNMFRDQTGNRLITAFSDGGYLIVYSDKGEELWRSDDKFGGSETFFLRPSKDTQRFYGETTIPSFIEQRISVTGTGEILVPQNSGFFVVGNSRSYTKHSVVALAWNGSSLEESWRTKQSPNYLADYSYDPAAKELVTLEVTQQPGAFGAGASALKALKLQ